MKHYVNKLSGRALDYATLCALGDSEGAALVASAPANVERITPLSSAHAARRGVVLIRRGNRWRAQLGTLQYHAKTPLTAAMRCIVASVYGPSIQLPESIA